MVSFFLPFFPLERRHIRQLFHMRVSAGIFTAKHNQGTTVGQSVGRQPAPHAGERRCLSCVTVRVSSYRGRIAELA